MPPTQSDTRFERIEKRQDTNDQVLADMKRTQDRLDIIFTSFTEEMKEMKKQDVDISLLLQQHDKILEKQKNYWDTFFSYGRWTIALIVSIGLLFLGTLISHIHF